MVPLQHLGPYVTSCSSLPEIIYFPSLFRPRRNITIAKAMTIRIPPAPMKELSACIFRPFLLVLVFQKGHDQRHQGQEHQRDDHVETLVDAGELAQVS